MFRCETQTQTTKVGCFRLLCPHFRLFEIRHSYPELPLDTVFYNMPHFCWRIDKISNAIGKTTIYSPQMVHCRWTMTTAKAAWDRWYRILSFRNDVLAVPALSAHTCVPDRRYLREKTHGPETFSKSIAHMYSINWAILLTCNTGFIKWLKTKQFICFL